MFFLEGFWMNFGRDFGAKMEEKSIQKRCQKHVGIDLEVELAKTQKMIPLTAFWLFFLIKLGPKSIKNRWKMDPQSREFFDQVFGSILNGFWEDFGPILGAKMKPKSIQKRVRRFLKKRWRQRWPQMSQDSQHTSKKWTGYAKGCELPVHWRRRRGPRRNKNLEL